MKNKTPIRPKREDYEDMPNLYINELENYIDKIELAMNYRYNCGSENKQLCSENDYGKIVAIHRFENGKWVEYKNK